MNKKIFYKDRIKNITCWKCGKIGHYANRCTKIKLIDIKKPRKDPWYLTVGIHIDKYVKSRIYGRKFSTLEDLENDFNEWKFANLDYDIAKDLYLPRQMYSVLLEQDDGKFK